MATSLKVHVHTSSPDAFFVNSFIIEGDRSLVLIDTQFVISEAKSLVDRITSLRKPLGAILITHPHPDHYNGLATILESYPGTRIYATASTIDGIRETAEPKRAYWTPIIGADYPQKFVWPDVTIRDGEKLRIDGIDLIVDDFGPSECTDNTVIELPAIDAVIVSDLVYNRVHPWLAEGRSELWLAALNKANHRFSGAKTLFAGHGVPGPLAIIDEQAAYIHSVRDMVANTLKQDPELSASSSAALEQKMKEAYPDWPLETIIGMNTRSLAAESRASRT